MFLKSPQATPECHSCGEKLHQGYRVRAATSSSRWFWKWLLSLWRPPVRVHVLFAPPNFIPCKMLSSPKSLQKQLPENARDRSMIFVHFLFIVWQETKAQREQEHLECLRSLLRGLAQTCIYLCHRDFFWPCRLCALPEQFVCLSVPPLVWAPPLPGSRQVAHFIKCHFHSDNYSALSF